MNIFRLQGDCSHVLAIFGLLVKIWWTRDCSGISIKSQFLYALVFTTRYLDLFTTFISVYNTALKIFFIVTTYATVLSMLLFFSKTREKEHDTNRIGTLIILCFAMSLLINHEFSYLEVFWTFSVYLEIVAMLPQFYFIANAKRTHEHILCYIAILTIYKGCYIANWVYRYYEEFHYDFIAITAAIVQIILYCDFFLRIIPGLHKVNNDKLPTIATIEAEVATGFSKTGHLAGNVGNIVLTPASLTGIQIDKANILGTEKPVEKY